MPTFIDAKHAIAHNKVVVIDGETVITGSFNFSKAAESSNAENLLVIHDRELAAKYGKNWQKYLQHSEKVCGKVSSMSTRFPCRARRACVRVDGAAGAARPVC